MARGLLSLGRRGGRALKLRQQLEQRSFNLEVDVNPFTAPFSTTPAAHGEGSEGHQPPYVALGDHTMLQEGMTFSNEPGLYVPELGFGYNHSDVVLVTARRGVQLGSVPYTKDWCFLSI